MINFPFKEYRCKHCNKLFFKGDIQHATIEVKCKNCKNISLIKNADCKLWLLMDKQGSYKRSSGVRAAPASIINNAIVQCEQCKESGNCVHYKIMKQGYVRQSS